MIAYGDDFPDFLEDAAAAFGLPYLPDVARLENAWVEAYHAEEAGAVGLADLAAHPPAALLTARVEFHPAARLLRFATPAGSIWASHQAGAGPAAAAERGEDVLVARPEADVGVRILPAEAYAFATRLASGATLLEAAGALDDPGSFGTHLVGLVEAGAIASIVPGDPL